MSIVSYFICLILFSHQKPNLCKENKENTLIGRKKSRQSWIAVSITMNNCVWPSMTIGNWYISYLKSESNSGITETWKLVNEDLVQNLRWNLSSNEMKHTGKYFSIWTYMSLIELQLNHWILKTLIVELNTWIIESNFHIWHDWYTVLNNLLWHDCLDRLSFHLVWTSGQSLFALTKYSLSKSDWSWQ